MGPRRPPDDGDGRLYQPDGPTVSADGCRGHRLHTAIRDGALDDKTDFIMVMILLFMCREEGCLGAGTNTNTNDGRSVHKYDLCDDHCSADEMRRIVGQIFCLSCHIDSSVNLYVVAKIL